MTRSDIYIPRVPRAKLREFTLKELEKATSNFSLERMVGRGGFGPVFKGTLSDGAAVAVKVLGKDCRRGLEQFQAEMTVSYLIMRSSYTNLVPAIGYHSSLKWKKVKVMIVYPFMVNEDVGCYLNDREPPRSPLNWPTRKRIALGVARGISSLHELGIIHRDIKPSNVLLDEDFNAYVGDLGTAKSIGLPHESYEAAEFCWGKDRTECSTAAVMGTIGYMDPEYLSSGRCSRETDVYSFGVTLIQLVTGMSVIDRSKGERAHIVWRAEQLLKNKEDLTGHMHPDLLGKHDESEAIELLRLGLICTQHSRKRPLMPEVIAIMEGSGVASDMMRWDNYDNYSLLPAYSQSSDISSPPTSVYLVGAGENDRGDDDEEAYEENGGIGNQLQRAEDFQPEESNKEDQVGNVRDRHQGPQFAISCSNPKVPIDASISVAESTGQTDTSSLDSDISVEIIREDQNERRNSKRLSLQAKLCQGNSEEIATKLKGVIDQMREMELNHRMAMEEMHQKQMAMMQSMIKMQSQIDRLKEEAFQKL